MDDETTTMPAEEIETEETTEEMPAEGLEEDTEEEIA